MTKIKVINVITDTNIGGAGKVLQNYLAHYNKKKFNVRVVIPTGSPLAQLLSNYGAEIIEFDKLAGKSLDVGSIFPMLSLFKQYKPDIVHTHASLSARAAARLYGKCKIIYTRHCAYPPSAFMSSSVGKIVGKITAGLFSDKAIAISPAVKKNLTDTGVPGEIIEVMMNGVEPLKLMNSEEKTVERKKYGIGSDEIIIGMVGRLEPVKGHEYFIKAAKMCIDDGMALKFLIAGSGGIEAELKKLAVDLGIADKIIFTGFLEDVTPVVNIMDVFVNASYGTEASSLAMLEAMSLAKPVIATNYGGNPYQVKNGETGLLVPIKEPDYIFDAIVKLVTDKDIYKQFSRNTKADYIRHYTAEVMTNRIEKIYTTTLRS